MKFHVSLPGFSASQALTLEFGHNVTVLSNVFFISKHEERDVARKRAQIETTFDGIAFGPLSSEQQSQERIPFGVHLHIQK